MSKPLHRAYVGLGSNLDQPIEQVETAIQELDSLPDSRLVEASPLYRSRPLGPPQPDYINAVAALDTSLEPIELLDQLQALEYRHKRERLEHWGPRTLDLDLLVYDAVTMDHPRLQLPHPEMHRRNFVLYPLADIAPGLVLPSGNSIKALLANTPRTGLEPLSP